MKSRAMTVTMPNREEIRGDIPLLIHHFLKKYRKEYERPELEFSEEALQRLLRRYRIAVDDFRRGNP